MRYSRQSAKQNVTVFWKFPVMHIRAASVHFSHSCFVALFWFASCSGTDVAVGLGYIWTFLAHPYLPGERKKEKNGKRKKERNERKERKKPKRKKERKRDIDIRFEVLNVLALKIQVFCIVGLSIRFIFSRRFEQTYRIYPWPLNVEESINLVVSVTTRKISVLTNENEISRIKILGAKTVKKLIIIIIIIIILVIHD